MEYREIPYVKQKVSRIFLGTASPSFLKGEENNALLDASLAYGINAIDTARNYALSEKSIGRWLRDSGKRDQVVILSKCAHPDLLGRKRISEKEIRKDYATSTELLGTDYIDIYLLHRDDPKTDVSVSVEVFNALHAEGKIGAFGGSNWDYRRIQEANEYAYKHNLIPFSVSSPHFGLARQQQDPWGGGCVTITGAENEDARRWYEETQMPVISYSSLGRGVLSGKLKSEDADHAGKILDAVAMKGYGCSDNYERLARCEKLAREKNCTVAQIAMAWIYHQKINTFAVVTMSSPARIEANIASLSLSLTDEESRWLNLETEKYSAEI